MTESFIFDRMIAAVAKIHQRLHRIAHSLNQADVPYAIVDECAVAAWVGQIDPSAVRNTPDVEVLIRREDFARVLGILNDAGFLQDEASETVRLKDGLNAGKTDVVQVHFCGDIVPHGEPERWPAVASSVVIHEMRVLALLPLTMTLLAAFRALDCVLVQDMMSVGLVDETWKSRLPPPLALRLQHLLDTPDG